MILARLVRGENLEPVTAARACQPRQKPVADDELEQPMRFVDGSFYEEMRRAALHLLRSERPGHPFDACDRVHDALLRIMSARKPLRVQDRVHLAALGVITMRRVLIDYFRTSGARVNGRGRPISLETVLVGASTESFEGRAVRLSLEKLALVNHRSYMVVVSHFFLGLSIDETAIRLGVLQPHCQARLERCTRLALRRSRVRSRGKVSAATRTSSSKVQRRRWARSAQLADERSARTQQHNAAAMRHTTTAAL